MSHAGSEELEAVRSAVAGLCARFPDAYWRDLDARSAYPDEFVRRLTDEGWLSVLIPERYGGGGAGIGVASVVLEEVNAQGGNAASCHAQMYTMGSILRHGSDEQKARYLPEIAKGTLRLQAFGVTEPDAGSETTAISTRAVRHGDRYVINGRKMWTSRFAQSDLMLLLARTTARAEVARPTEGLSLFIVDLREAGASVSAQPIPTMMNHHTNAVFIEDLEVGADALIGQEGQGFRHLLDGLNAERILVAAECVGDGRWFVRRGAAYATERVVFGRPIGQNQGVQFPIARAHAAVEAADLMRWKAVGLYEAGRPAGPEANMAKLLASEASWQAANACMDAHGGYGFAAEYDVERKFRETRLYLNAPVTNNLVLAFIGQNLLKMPKSY